LADGSDIRSVRGLPGQGEARTTMIYTRVWMPGGRGIRSPADVPPHRSWRDRPEQPISQSSERKRRNSWP